MITIFCNEMKETTQKAIILAELKDGKTVTALEAFKLCGSLRLSSIIFSLRDEGYNITTTMVERNGKHIAEYSLKDRKENGSDKDKEADTSK